MNMKLVQLLIAGSTVLLISCNSEDNSNSADNSGFENTVNELKENQTNILALQDNQKDILKKIQTMERSIANLTLANKNRPAKNQQPKVDPNKVYSVKIGDSFVQGNKNAKVTIIEWSDYF